MARGRLHGLFRQLPRGRAKEGGQILAGGELQRGPSISCLALFGSSIRMRRVSSILLPPVVEGAGSTCGRLATGS